MSRKLKLKMLEAGKPESLEARSPEI